jgi:hypothetical protein
MCQHNAFGFHFYCNIVKYMLMLSLSSFVVVVVVMEEHIDDLNVITALFWVITQRVLVISYRRLRDSLSVLDP